VERDLEQRIALNEARFREVNEGIARGQWPGEEDAPVGFRCECAQLSCTQLVELTVAEYESVRAHSRRFVVAIGHEVAGAETVVGTQAGYVVVEKLDEAGRVAQETDPRG